MAKAVFLDRDGVINKDKGYVYKVEDFEFVDGIFDACKVFVAQGYQIIVVTNQSGIARGYYQEADFHELTAWMCEAFSQQGVVILDVKFCPYHPSAGLGAYKQDSPYRKPNPQMILDAACEYDIDLSLSVMIGDKRSDAQAALAAGVGRIFLLASRYEQMQTENAKVYDSLAELVAAEFNTGVSVS